MTETPRPPEGPDREALRERIAGALHYRTCHADDSEDHDDCLIAADAVLALLPTPPAPGGPLVSDEELATRDWTPCLPGEDEAAPGDGEGLRAEVENAVTDLQAEWASLTSDPGSTGYRTGLGAAITRVRAALARATPEETP
jgi:hypothetical protein